MIHHGIFSAVILYCKVMNGYGLVLSVVDLCSQELTGIPGYEGRIDCTSYNS